MYFLGTTPFNDSAGSAAQWSFFARDTKPMILRDVTIGDVDAYVRMRCDPAMMNELGGPQRRETIDAKVRKDVESVERDQAWICMIVPDASRPEAVAGSVVLWSHSDDAISEIGWMVLPEFQNRGIAKAATKALLVRARDDGRWGLIHAFPGVNNAPSNALCRSLGFQLVGN